MVFIEISQLINDLHQSSFRAELFSKFRLTMVRYGCSQTDWHRNSHGYNIQPLLKALEGLIVGNWNDHLFCHL